jgi:hypothetical protein
MIPETIMPSTITTREEFTMIFANATVEQILDYYNTFDPSSIRPEMLEEEIRGSERVLAQDMDTIERSATFGDVASAYLFQFGDGHYAKLYLLRISEIFDYEDGYRYFSNGTYVYSHRLHTERVMAAQKQLLAQRG